MASSIVSSKCSANEECKKNAIVKCDGCAARFCSNHFPVHRQELETQLEWICSDRDHFYHQLAQQSQDPTDLLAQIDQWEQQTLANVQRTANAARERIRLLLTRTDYSNPQFEQFSQELKRRKENEDYFENDVERLRQQLEYIKFQAKQSLEMNIQYTFIDWQTIIHINLKNQQHIPTHYWSQDTPLLTVEYQTILNNFCGKSNQQWQLIYRGTRDGFGKGAFISQCANQGPTITMVRVDKYLFGGYTSISWKHSDGTIWDRDPTAFLFTLINPHQIPPTKYPIKSTGENAIRSYAHYGPTFGRFDICIHSDSNLHQHSNFGFPKDYCDTTQIGKITFTGAERFTTSEIEIYKQV